MPSTIDPEQIVADMLARRPEIARVFLRRGMACVGCAMAPFMTLREAAASYGLPLDELLAELAAAAAAPQESG